MFETIVIMLYFAVLALPLVGIVVGLRFFPPNLDTSQPPSATEDRHNT
jgi:hypothetical protein